MVSWWAWWVHPITTLLSYRSLIRSVVWLVWLYGSSESLPSWVRERCTNIQSKRITIARPFTTTGVDLSGFYHVKCRSIKRDKVYIAFFVCFVTRAVHIELVIDLSTDSFLMTLERFVSRRGLPEKLYSDDATNYVGTRNLLDHSKIVNFATSKSINWKFIAPRSPHQGGLWESAVKSGKA